MFTSLLLFISSLQLTRADSKQSTLYSVHCVKNIQFAMYYMRNDILFLAQCALLGGWGDDFIATPCARHEPRKEVYYIVH